MKNMGESSVRFGQTSISVRGIMAVILVVTVCAVSLLGIQMNETLSSLCVAVVSFYYGQRRAKQSEDKE